MDLYSKIEQFFQNHKQIVSINEIIKYNHLNTVDISNLSHVLYTLECEGKVISDEFDNYIHIAKNYYLYSGIVEQSAHDNFIIRQSGGKIIMINKEKTKQYLSLKQGDNVFIELSKDSKYKNKYNGKLIKIIKEPSINISSFLAKGIIKVNSKDNFYIEVNNKKYLILINHMNSAYINDYVTVECITKNGKDIAIVKDIIERKTNQHVFIYKNVGGAYKMVPLGTENYDINFKYNHNDFVEGDTVLLELDKMNNAKFVKKLDNQDTIISKIKLQAYDRGFPVDFSNEAIDYAKNISSEITRDEINKRVDLRNIETFTIDPPNCQDMDDAVSLEKLQDHYRLYVSIADVTHYVRPNDIIFKEAIERTTSIYPSDYCFPMLPKRISNEICSLNEKEDKLTKTCIIDIDFKGNILNYLFVDSIINSNKKMSYDKANNTLKSNTPLDYIEYNASLKEMQNLSNILSKRREKRGNIVFPNQEVKYKIKDDTEVVGIEEVEHGEAQEIIENFMLIANECAANLATNFDIPFVYRNHEKPDLNKLYDLKFKINDLKKYSKELLYSQDPKKLQNIINKICEGKTTKEKIAISNLFIRSLQRANYGTNNNGHYALALSAYATFTSPIRRLPDLLNHLIIESVINDDITNFQKYTLLFTKLADRSTIIQKEVEDFERDIDNQLLRSFLIKHYNQNLAGTIDFIMDNYAYIETSEGINGYLIVNKNSVRNNKIKIDNTYFSVNSPVNVQISSVSEHSQDVEFRLIKKL